ncbi:MAG TPA: hypothetical protein DEA78_12570 [Cyanobacteria bacterium UBA11159]|nr:hypothetical protein [Cyanobacteria bacterium UBA11166]HBR74516.1 hypothetical protein [Cyanobacteria bacterium UBA11159]HBS72547.1 hypothetical protein [Cyanobacteria bacterium UBA11153]
MPSRKLFKPHIKKPTPHTLPSRKDFFSKPYISVSFFFERSFSLEKHLDAQNSGIFGKQCQKISLDFPPAPCSRASLLS